MVLRALLVAALGVVVACDDDGSRMDGGEDAGVSDALLDTSPLVSAVGDVVAPDFSACPSGWRSARHPTLDVDVCEPWSEGGPAACAPHEMLLPGAAGCVRIGSECPADGWPASLPTAGVVYVRADAAAGGDGSRAAPFRTVNEAAATAPDGGTIAVAVGEYDGRIEVSGSLAIVGACAEGVVLYRSSVGGHLPVIDVRRDASLEIRDVTLRSDQSDRFLVMFASISVRDTVFDGVGVTQFGGDADVERALFTGIADDMPSLLSVTGVDRASVRRVSVEDTDVGGMTLLAEDSISVADVAVRNAGGIGIQVRSADVGIERVVVEDVEGLGMTLGGAVLGADLVVRGVTDERNAAGGISSTGDADLARVRVDRAGDVGLSLIDGEVRITGLVVDGGSPDVGYARGLEIAEGGNASLSGVAMGAMNDFGFLVTGEGAFLSVEDLSIAEVESGPTGGFGRCLHAQLGADVVASRTHFTRCREAAVTASTAASVVMRDARVERILPLACARVDCPDAQAGIGFVALEGDGAIDVERFVISEAALAAVQVIEGGSIDLRDGTIRDNPVGINVQVEGYDLARLMDRVVFENNGLNLDSSELPVPAATATPSAP